MTIGERIKAARKKAGLKQAELAEKLGVAAITIGQYERNQRQPRYDMLQRIAAALGVSAQDLVDWGAVDKEEFKRLFIYGDGLDSDYMTMGERIKAAREQAGITQIELSEKAGIVIAAIQQYEEGKCRPRIERLLRIAQALGVDVERLIDMKTASEYEKNVIRMSKADSAGGVLHRTSPAPQARIAAAMNKLNTEGQEKAAERVEELTEIPRYQAQEPPQEAPGSTPPVSEGKDTTPEETPTEGRITSITMMCPICGKTLHGNPATGKAHCAYCNRSFPLPPKIKSPKP